MGDILVTSMHLDTVRQALGVSSDVVSDDLIRSMAFLDLVEGEVKETIADWSDLISADGQDALRLRAGTAYWVAARLCGYLQLQESQVYKLADYSHSATQVDWPAKVAELSGEAARWLTKITTATTPGRPKLFIASGPTRSRENVPASYSEWLDKIQPLVLDWMDDLNVAGDI